MVLMVSWRAWVCADGSVWQFHARVTSHGGGARAWWLEESRLNVSGVWGRTAGGVMDHCLRRWRYGVCHRGATSVNLDGCWDSFAIV
jgi:hypothetical protein